MARLVVGLGNPGPEYEWTRHNVGFQVLDRIAKTHGLFFQPAQSLDGYDGPRAFQCARSTELDALFVKPGSYMNRSGDIVRALARWLQLDPADLMLVYDDFDLPLGSLRIRPHGGSGTHNGMRSILESLATDRFPRLRVGIGAARTDAARHVLEPFTDKERVEIEISVAEAAEAVVDWLKTGDLQGCMTRFHSRWNLGNEPGGSSRITHDKE